MRRVRSICLLVAWVLLGLAVWGQEVRGKGTYEIGGADYPWEGVGTLSLLEVEVDGTVHPLHFDPEENVTPTTYERGGRIFIANPKLGGYGGYGRAGAEEWTKMIDRDVETAYVRGVQTPQSSGEYWDIFYFDLGGVLPVRRIRFYPRVEYPFRALPTFELSINDGKPEHRDVQGTPLAQHVVLARPRAIHGEVLQEVSFPLQPVRYVILNPVSPEPGTYWEVAEIEVYGGGYVPYASYLSDFVDMGDLTSWGEIRWTGRRDEDAKVLIHTRTGIDDDPDVYWMKTGREDRLTNKGPTRAPLTKKEYDQLPTKVKGPITYDSDNWSFWSAPYDFDAGFAGVGIVSPGPRRYIQIRMDLFSTWTDAAYLERLTFEYSKPPVATDVVGEIWPDEVELGQRTRFVYALRPDLRARDSGFDGVEIVTMIPADTIRSVRLGGEEIPFSASYLEDPARFVVAFPEHRIDASRTGKVLEIEFDASVFRYSTEFTARVLDTSGNEVSQLVRPGNATVRIPSDGISVRTSLGEGTLGSVSADPRTVTPNGDGINDVAEITYDLFKLTRGAEVELRIHALSGERIRLVHTGFEVSGRYRHGWDGRDEDGGRVPPGVYVYFVEVRTDEGVERRAGTVCVAY